MINDNIIILKTGDYEVLLEPRESVLFLHITVNKYNKTVLKELQKAWPLVKQYCWGCGYDDVFIIPKSVKFMRQVIGNDAIQIMDDNLYIIGLDE